MDSVIFHSALFHFFLSAVHDPLNWFHSLPFEKLLWVISSTLLALNTTSVLMTFPFLSLPHLSLEILSHWLSPCCFHVDVQWESRVAMFGKALLIPFTSLVPLHKWCSVCSCSVRDGDGVQAPQSLPKLRSEALGSYTTSLYHVVFIWIKWGCHLYLLGLLWQLNEFSPEKTWSSGWHMACV